MTTKNQNKLAFCEHAELNAARQLNNRLLRKRDKNKNKRDLKKMHYMGHTGKV